MSDKQRTLHLKPFHSEVVATENGLDWSFFGRTDNGGQHRIVLHMDFWWVRFLARDLWKVIAERKKGIASGEAALKGEQP